jgi:DNA-binding PadR family transcriptional regulator
MPRGSGFSAQTLLVLAALSAQPADWRHGYDLAKETELKSGTLYPILVRLADRGLVEARWEDGRPAGRPPRHLYRLSSEGLDRARAALAAVPAADARPGPASRRAGPRQRGLAGEGL